jgi:hypothetical protein
LASGAAQANQRGDDHALLAGCISAGCVSIKVSGDKLGAVLDGSQQLISVTSIPWYSRQVYLPAL